MANTLIQIKRSNTTATPASLSKGELAYSNATQVLYIGAPYDSTVLPIGGVRNPGVLTANQALVANSTKGIDEVYAAKGNVAVLYVWNVHTPGEGNGSPGNVLFSNGDSNVYWQSAGGLGVNTDAQYTWSNTQTYANTITFSKDALFGGVSTLNSLGIFTTQRVGANDLQIGTTAANLYGNTTYMALSNSTANVQFTPQSITLANATISAVHNTSAFYIGNSTSNALVNSTAIVVNGAVVNSTYLGFAAISTYVNTSGSFTLAGNLNFTGANDTFSGANHTITSTNCYVSSNLTVAGTNTVITSNASFSGANVNIAGTNTYITSNVTITGANIDATSAVLRARDGIFGGNLTVSGTLTTIDTTNMQVKDNFIGLADGNQPAGAFTDAIDIGFFGYTGNTANPYYSGLARIAASSTNTNPYFELFSTTTLPGSGTLTAPTEGTLQAYLVPYGVGGAFVVNSSAMSLVANSTVSLAITANTLSLATPLPVSNIAAGTDGQVLQMSDTTVQWNSLDGGTF